MEEKKSPRAKRQTASSEPEETAPVKKTAAKRVGSKKAGAANKSLSKEKSGGIAEKIEASETVMPIGATDNVQTAGEAEAKLTPKAPKIRKTVIPKSPEAPEAKEKKVPAKKAATQPENNATAAETVKSKRKTAARKTSADIESTDAEASDSASVTKPTTESQIKIESKVETIREATEEISTDLGELSVDKESTEIDDKEEMEAVAEPEAEQSEVFKQLASPVLPTLAPENRARLQIQSPGRVFLYWSIKNNPYETLHRAFGNRAEGYQLVVKLKDLNRSDERLFPIENEGSWWFDAESNTSYQAEIGFYAEARPFIRLMFSNTTQTPRTAPSPNTDWSMDFNVSAEQFAEVLDAAGYSQDAFDVALAGDDQQASDEATQKTFSQITGVRAENTEASELRYALFMLASHAALEQLRGQISQNLYLTLEKTLRENAEKLSAENIHLALKENFVFEGEGDEFVVPVFGASSINFPKKSKRPKFSPISSLR